MYVTYGKPSYRYIPYVTYVTYVKRSSRYVTYVTYGKSSSRCDAEGVYRDVNPLYTCS